jgi:nuclear GTP-binding protein
MAKIILMDWQRGKIPFFVPPPKDNTNTVINTNTVSTTGDIENQNDKVNFNF